MTCSRLGFSAQGVTRARLFAAREQDGTPLADCRVNGEDWAHGAQALRKYAITWPAAGYEFRKQYVVLQSIKPWLIFRTEQLDDYDRIWSERIERRGKQITVVANLAKWQGKYFRNFTYYQVIVVNLGKLEPGQYETKWVMQPLEFTKFDGDGKAVDSNFPKDERRVEKKPTELRVSFSLGNNLVTQVSPRPAPSSRRCRWPSHGYVAAGGEDFTGAKNTLGSKKASTPRKRRAAPGRCG